MPLPTTSVGPPAANGTIIVTGRVGQLSAAVVPGSKFQRPPFHPKWRDINLAATVPGWTRFSVAQHMLDHITSQQSSFQTFLSTRSQMPTSDADRDALFQDFLQWQQRTGTHQKLTPVGPRRAFCGFEVLSGAACTSHNPSILNIAHKGTSVKHLAGCTDLQSRLSAATRRIR